MLTEKKTIFFDGSEEELHEAFVRALNKHCGAYMMPLFIDPPKEGAIFDSHNKERNKALFDFTVKEIKEDRELYDRLTDKIISELRGVPVPKR